MIITLSEERNEKIVFEWGDEITDEHAQDFCDVCNEVFTDHYTVPYIKERFGVNIYGAGYITVAYKDDKPLSCLGGIRNDIDGIPGFQHEHFASMPSIRETSGYILETFFCIYDEVSKLYPDALFWTFPGSMAYPVYKAAGYASAVHYMRIYHGANEDFLESMPLIPDDYAEAFTFKKKNAAIMKIHGKYYAVMKRTIKHYIPAGTILGEVSSRFYDKVPHVGIGRVYLYSSLKPGILRNRNASNVIMYRLGQTKQTPDIIPDDYKSCHYSSDFFKD